MSSRASSTLPSPDPCPILYLPLIVLHEALAGQVLVRASVEHVSLSVFVLLVVLGIPLLLVQRVLDLRVKVSRILYKKTKIIQGYEVFVSRGAR